MNGCNWALVHEKTQRNRSNCKIQSQAHTSIIFTNFKLIAYWLYIKNIIYDYMRKFSNTSNIYCLRLTCVGLSSMFTCISSEVRCHKFGTDIIPQASTGWYYLHYSAIPVFISLNIEITNSVKAPTYYSISYSIIIWSTLSRSALDAVELSERNRLADIVSLHPVYYRRDLYICMYSNVSGLTGRADNAVWTKGSIVLQVIVKYYNCPYLWRICKHKTLLVTRLNYIIVTGSVQETNR